MRVKELTNSVAITCIILGMPMLWMVDYVTFNQAIITQLVMVTSGVVAYGEQLKREQA